MTGATILLAAHGSGDDSASNAFVHALTARLSNDLAPTPVLCAFRKGRPSFAEAIASVTGDSVIVIPVMTSEGYFSTRVLPAAIAESPRAASLRVTMTAPLGLHPAFVEITESLLAGAVAQFAPPIANTTFLVVGHGTPRHADSRSRTVEVVEAIAARRDDWDIRPAFIDEPPYVRDVVATLASRHVIATPFLIGGGHHATIDIPEQLGALREDNVGAAPFANIAGGVMRICTEAVGMHTSIPDLAREIALAELTESKTGAH
ncbi:MAG TPA: ferrochelatase [Phycisphaerae bacterium]|nr:ferrochelatase [Phycisphaerae bacterium]HRW54884.1 ferrochelatase [Phycisphaerae bacterium]